ncbi:restriction endonuclease subunit S [Nitrosomonas nitrosa]|jgi:type I restriction enzyme S subunit|uniref:restriction endonuclease subunit S n=1 Tax=Nitrosomonas nitrosa TaxID=52442 RepID=UPI0023F76E9C|nr:restriction endonuclease subunit S [Nitrosomonas nitrosa]MCO6432792.1 restriction endonuclease subunit S [Nitrosomonas nitrosa]
MELKPGYKQTEVGVIPEDWVLQPLSSLTILITNGFVGPVKSHYTERDGGVLYIQGYNIEENSFNFNGIKHVTQEFHKKQSKSCLHEGDLLTIQTGDVGLTTYVPSELAGSNCHALIITRFKNDKYISKFFSYYLNSHKGRARLKEIETGTTMKHINVGDMVHFLVPYPPTKIEQTAIANVLSDADALIQSLTRLIAKKRQIKQGTMQTLLNPYENEKLKDGWEEKKLGEIGIFRGGSGFPRRYQGKTEGLYPFYKVSDMNNEGNEKLMVNANNWIDEKIKKEIGAITFPKNTIIFAKIGAAIFLERKKILNQESCIDNNMMGYIFDTNLYDAEYLHYLFQTIPLGKLVSTTALPSLNGKEIATQKYYFPNKLEQTGIATILSDMDAEIAALETKLAKYRRIKQGMMQNLLTGRIRLI